jgi:hypothetical protein
LTSRQQKILRKLQPNSHTKSFPSEKGGLDYSTELNRIAINDLEKRKYIEPTNQADFHGNSNTIKVYFRLTAKGTKKVNKMEKKYGQE